MMGHRVIGTALAQRCSLERLTNRNEQCVATKKKRSPQVMGHFNSESSFLSIFRPRYIMLSHVISCYIPPHQAQADVNESKVE